MDLDFRYLNGFLLSNEVISFMIMKHFKVPYAHLKIHY